MRTETPPPVRPPAVPSPGATRAWPTVSVVIPVYNERGTLEQLYREVTEELARQARDHQIVFIDDGSTDGSTEVMLQLAAADPRVQVYRFRGNRGKAEALNFGFAQVTGEVV